ncbi:Beta galactosidase small chain [Izhakiella capsodis]|uniref:Beta galactosidase small chain n=1 Tax=Izhakiella capsodis TaxID=1367852 RepID=A0A1I4W6A2_9GAMM|nr:Beta galactosidase small chain [Izhakiella capsodis]
MYTPNVFPSENGLRCDVPLLSLGAKRIEGNFHFSVSRFSLEQLRGSSHVTCSLKSRGAGSISMVIIGGLAATTHGVRQFMKTTA